MADGTALASFLGSSGIGGVHEPLKESANGRIGLERRREVRKQEERAGAAIREQKGGEHPIATPRAPKEYLESDIGHKYELRYFVLDTS